MSVWTWQGRSKVTVNDHLQLLRAFQPNAFECLYDSTPSSETSMKRVRREGRGGGGGWRIWSRGEGRREKGGRREGGRGGEGRVEERRVEGE